MQTYKASHYGDRWGLVLTLKLYFSQPPNYKFLLEVSGKKSIVHRHMNGEQGASPTQNDGACMRYSLRYT